MLGIIGGTGLYKMEELNTLSYEKISTPFGSPSADILIGELKGEKIAFLPRHGTHHEFLPSEINYRANIWALKAIGVRQILSISAVGSLRAEIHPGDLVTPNQYLDWTKGKRESSFFGKGLIAHVSTAYPSCHTLGEVVMKTSKELDLKIWHQKTYVCVEGPRLGTRAESLFLQQMGCDIVGMTNVPEAFLAREAQICYCTIAIATDYDCWLDDASQHVTIDKILELYKSKLKEVQCILVSTIPQIALNSESKNCSCRQSLASSLLTPLNSLSKENKEIWEFLSK